MGEPFSFESLMLCQKTTLFLSETEKAAHDIDKFDQFKKSKASYPK